jgi:hypothetical protein
VRGHAYQLPSDIYRELEAQILPALANADYQQLDRLLSEHDLKVELLSGEWRVLFAETEDAYFQVVDHEQRRARMAVSPDELAEFVELLRDPERQKRWTPISFGLAELVDALPVGVDLVGVVFVEESDDWMWVEHTHEILAIRPEVFSLLEPHFRKLIAVGDHGALARLAGDHCEGAIEFSQARWDRLLAEIAAKEPELLAVIRNCVALPVDYAGVREALGNVANPQVQPSLDAWLRVHSTGHDYALYFRDLARERE